MSTGNYVLLMIIAPIVVWFAFKVLWEKSFSVFDKLTILIGLSIFVSLIGMICHNYFIGSTIRNNMPLISGANFFQNIQKCIEGLFMLFGGLASSEDVMVLSITGIGILTSFLFVCICFLLIFFQWRKQKNKRLLNIFLVFAIINLMVLFLTSLTYGAEIYEYRYHILWCSFMLILVSYIVWDNKIYHNNWIRNCVILLLFIISLIINGKGFYKLFSSVDRREKADYVLSLADQQGVDGIYVYNDPSLVHIIRALDLNKVCLDVSFLEESGIQISCGNFYNYYIDNFYGSKGENILISSQENFDLLPSYIKNVYMKKYELGDGSNMYYSNSNPWDAVGGLPEKNGEIYKDFSYSKGYIWNGTYDNSGNAIGLKTDSDGYVLESLHTLSHSGTYNIVLQYQILTTGNENARLEIVAADTQTIILTRDLPNEQETLELTNVSIPAENIEVRIWKDNETEIKMESITYEKVK